MEIIEKKSEEYETKNLEMGYIMHEKISIGELTREEFIIDNKDIKNKIKIDWIIPLTNKHEIYKKNWYFNFKTNIFVN